MKFNTSLPDDDVNVSKSSALSDLTWMVLGTMLILLFLYFTLGSLIELGVKNISVKNEQKFFSYLPIDTLFKEENNQSTPYQKLLDESAHCFNSPYHFILNLSEDNVSNAYALPGGFIIINQGLIHKATSENELFFVLAHEVGHFKNRDHLEGIGRGFMAITLSAMMGLSDASELMSTSLNFGESHFSKSAESEADLYAVDMMMCRYGHSTGATDFFKHLPSDSQNTLFSSHPKTLERIKNLESYIKKKNYPVGTLKSFR